MKQKLFLLAGFFGFLPLTIFFLILYSLFLLYADTSNLGKNMTLFRTGVHFKALPEPLIQAVVEVEATDARVQALQQFFAKYKSPLQPYAELIVKTADKYNLDYRYIPSIAMQESNLCKKAPANSFNCWGFGIYGGKIKKFSGYEAAIEAVTKTLAIEYKQKGLEEPHDIMQKYTPSSNGSWAESVIYFMNQLESSI